MLWCAALPFAPLGQAHIPLACLSALETRDPSDNDASRRSHLSHESVWKIRSQLLFQVNRAPFLERDAMQSWATVEWRNYLMGRYLPLMPRFHGDLRQQEQMIKRIADAGDWNFAELGELEVAEKYLFDPAVADVIWIPRTETDQAPDLRVYYKDGSVKLVEVKTRIPLRYFNLKNVIDRIATANMQIGNYKRLHPEFESAHAEVSLVFAPSNRKLRRLRFLNHFFELVAKDFNRYAAHLTQVTVSIHNQPFVQISRVKRGSHSTVEIKYLPATEK